MPINHQTILLTGAASGIGRALLRALVSRYTGLTIVAADRDEPGLTAVLDQLPVTPANRVLPVVGDLADPAVIDQVFAVAGAPTNHVALVFANAGFAYYEAADTPDWERNERIFRVNTLAPLYLYQKTRALAAGRPFRVVITASAMAHLAIPGYALYSATKAALDRFRDAVRFEPGAARTLTLVYPVATRTNFFARATARQPPVTPWPSQTPEHVADAILRGVERRSDRIYPSVLFRLARLPLGLFEGIGSLYQRYYARQLNRWLGHR